MNVGNSERPKVHLSGVRLVLESDRKKGAMPPKDAVFILEEAGFAGFKDLDPIGTSEKELRELVAAFFARGEGAKLPLGSQRRLTEEEMRSLRDKDHMWMSRPSPL